MQDSLNPGLVLQERFRVERSISIGGWGEVYRGTDLHSGRPVAIKRTFPLRQDDAEEIDAVYAFRRFLEEVNVLENVDYPGIPKCLGSFTMLDDRHCLVMEFIEGVDLERHLQDHLKLAGCLISASTAVDYVIQACKILEYLHSLSPKPIVHRDIKPSNLILRHIDDRVYLVDFGFARPIGTSMGTKTMVGTIGYAPIEQCQGNPSPLSDLYALGATLHYLLTGKQPTPFDIQPLDRSRPELPQSLARAVATATRNEKSERFSSVYSFRRELERIQPELRNFQTSAPAVLPVPPAIVAVDFATDEEEEEEVEGEEQEAEPIQVPAAAPVVAPRVAHVPVPRGIPLNLEAPFEHWPPLPASRPEEPTPPAELSHKRPNLTKKTIIQAALLLALLIAGIGAVWHRSEVQSQLRLASETLPGWQPTVAGGLQMEEPGSVRLRATSPEDSHFVYRKARPSGFVASRPEHYPAPKSIGLQITAAEPATLWLYAGLQEEEDCHIYRIVLVTNRPDSSRDLVCNIFQEGHHSLVPGSLVPPSSSGSFLLPDDGDEMLHCSGLSLEVRAANLDRFGIMLQSSARDVLVRVGLMP